MVRATTAGLLAHGSRAPARVLPGTDRYQPCLPEPQGSVTRPIQQRERRTDQRLAADSCGGQPPTCPRTGVQPGRTVFPFHPLARDRRHATVAVCQNFWQRSSGPRARTGRVPADSILPPESSAIEVVSREVGVSVATLERWRADGLAHGSGDRRSGGGQRGRRRTASQGQGPGRNGRLACALKKIAAVFHKDEDV